MKSYERLTIRNVRRFLRTPNTIAEAVVKITRDDEIRIPIGKLALLDSTERLPMSLVTEWYLDDDNVLVI